MHAVVKKKGVTGGMPPRACHAGRGSPNGGAVSLRAPRPRFFLKKGVPGGMPPRACHAGRGSPKGGAVSSSAPQPRFFC